MGKIVAAIATVHAPQFSLVLPRKIPSSWMPTSRRCAQLGKDLDEVKPDAIIVHRQRSPGNVFPLLGADLRGGRRREVASALREQEL